MLKETKWISEFPMKDERDVAEFSTMVKVISDMDINGGIYGEAIKSDVYKITIEKIFST